MQSLVYVTREEDRAILVRAARASALSAITTFDAAVRARKSEAWDSLVCAAHERPSSIFIAGLDQLPGGPWNWLKQLARVASIDARLVSLREPGVTLESGQGELLRVLWTAREHEVRERTRSAVEKARVSGKHVGRPCLKVPVEKVVEARTRMSLRQTARHFGISPTSVWRICEEAERLRNRNEGAS